MEKSCTIEINSGGSWKKLGEVRLNGPEELGVSAPTVFEYDDDYAFTALGATDFRAASCRYPVVLGAHSEQTWSPFLLDLIPSGAGRRFWEDRLGLPNTRRSDWELLRTGALNPPGNLRVAEAAADMEPVHHDGFAREDIIVKSDRFLAYAQHNGIAVTGSSGANGDAPKMLLTERLDGRWQPNGTVAPESAKRDWIVKLPRGRDDRDRIVLRAEKTYYDVASSLGIKTAGPLQWEENCLFIPRFDVNHLDGKEIRYGLESLASAAGIAAFGAPISHEALVQTIRRRSSAPSADIEEYLARDVLNVAMGNTDNHARNNSFIKAGEGQVRLSPLYDFAPMMVDPALIPRVCKWDRQLDRAENPNWREIIDHISENTEERQRIAQRLSQLGKRLPEIVPRLEADNLSELILQRVAERSKTTAAALAQL